MAATNNQQTLVDYAAETTTESVTQTVVLPLETSQRKNQKVQTAIDEFNAMSSYLADMMPSLSEHERSPKNPTLYRLVTREFPNDDRETGSKVALAVTNHVCAAFKSRQERGDNGARPTFDDGCFFLLDNQNIDIAENERGYGVKARFVPYNPEWFHINPRPHAQRYLERVVNGDGDCGTAEFRLEEDSLTLHLPVSWDVEVYKPSDVSTTIGVDIGENVIYAAAVVSPDGVETVEMQSGREFRHHRQRLQDKRDQLGEQGDLRGLKKTRDEQRRYTEQVLDTASREIIDLAVEHAPAKVQLEDLTHYRETARDPIHDWPFALLQEKIAYKATAEGVPVEMVNPRNTSITCRQCGQSTPVYRDGDRFECRRCNYQVHADVNAAINIAQESA